ncbi:hypothetical protein MSAN_00408400 [Mycena sanguinolenta]|uniref:Uncharacterized protein n=1 Tax=Mycena sanguinolenta TaxID=230812 RepID=A0A8H6ZAA2_9AGAR|nr:hypothetical protein MSAN_00408400 [Mycena sanguinolenta]
MALRSSSANESALELPPITTLFAGVLERQLAQPSTPPIRRPSAWPGFPGPDRNALSSSGYPHASPPPPLQVGRRPSAPSTSSRPLDVLSSPSMFPNLHARDNYSTDNNTSHQRSLLFAEAQEHDSSNLHARRGSYVPPSHSSASFRPRRQSWSEPQPTHVERRETGRLPPIAMATAGSPRLYEREATRPRVREPACQHCAMDREIEERRAAAATRPPSSESPTKQQIPTPLPPAHGHTMIPFQPTSNAYAGRAFGVSMADILDFRPCLKDPDTPVLDNGLEQVFLTLEAKGYSTFVQTIAGNCPHRRISRFNLAYAVASAFDSFLKDFPFNPSGLKAAAIVVRSVAELRLVNLYSRDGRVWRVHVAYSV